MRLKRLEAHGFKSFADKLRLDFTDGVTCIVGPNGCGKSNVCDAIKWVLGEQNARNIRSGGQGKTMQEVIFKGTNSRKPMSFCEVTLTFDNADRFYGVDADELVITRKLFRSGDSEYYINGERAKLKEIINMFRDTGIGKDGYSVVGQGQIDAILSARPEDRRQIFEEAAGISGFKASRKETLTRLDRIMTNVRTAESELKIIADIIEPLKKEAEVARKAKSLGERIRFLDINHFLYVSDHSEEQRVKLREKLVRETSELSKVTDDRDEANRVYNEAKAELELLDVEYKKLHELRLDLSLKESARNKDSEHFKSRLAQIKSDIERITAELDEKRAQIVGNNKIIEENVALTAQREIECEKAKADEQNAIEEYNRLSSLVSQKEEEIKITNSLLLQNADESSALTADLAGLTAQKIALERNIERCDAEIAEHREEKKRIDKEVEALRKQIDEKKADILEKREEIKDFNEKYSELINKLNEEEAQYNERYGTISNLKGKLNLLMSSKDSYGSYDRAVQYLMNSSERNVQGRICGVLGRLIKVTNPKFAVAIETALGGAINNIVTETGEDATYLIQHLKAHGAGKATFLPLNMMHPAPPDPMTEAACDEDGCYGIATDLVRFDDKYYGAVETLLGRVLVAENNDCALSIKRKYPKVRIVTLDGDNFAASGAITGGSRGNNDSHILSIENQISEVQKQIAKLESSYAALTEDIKNHKEERKKMETANALITNMITKAQSDIDGLEKQKFIFAKNWSDQDSEIDRLQTEKNRTMQEITGLEAQITVQKMKSSTEKEKRTDSTDALTKLANELGRIKEEYMQADARRNETFKKARTVESELSAAKSMVLTAQKSNERLEKEVEEASALLESRKDEQTTLIADIERIVAQSSDSEELRKVNVRIGEMDDKKSLLTQKQEQAHKEEQEMAEAVSAIADRKARVEMALESIDKEIETLETDIKENYGLDYETAAESKDPEYNDAKGTAEAKSLRREVAALGNVNANAEETLAERQKEYDEKKLHYDDVVKARDAIAEEVETLTKKMESNFTESFEKVKVNFAEIFSMLFDGGHGRLDLDMGPNQSVLDAGIIIEAEPPGKKLQNIALLSGGEKALTAICIIFAIIKLNPMPFCVLDEVDAPLDESNATIYGRFLKRYSRNTQFIIISHRKPTIELADELYGITMQEQGVSKHLSIKLSEALKLANKGGATA